MRGIKIEYVVRLVLYSYSQLFFCTDVRLGFCVLLGMFLYSPQSALLALVAALLAILLSIVLHATKGFYGSNVLGSNAVLLGYVWVLYPELPFILKLIITLGGICFLVAIIFSLFQLSIYLKKNINLFAIPCLIVTWSIIAVLYVTHLYDINQYRGWSYFKNKNYSMSEEYFLITKPLDSVAKAITYNGLGWSLYHQERYLEAIDYFNKSVEKKTSFSDSYDGLGWSYFKILDLDSSRRYLQKALDLNPFLSDAQLGLAWNYIENKDFDNAHPAFLKSLLMSPLHFSAYDGLRQTSEMNNNKSMELFYSLLYSITHFLDVHSLNIFQMSAWLLLFFGLALYSISSFLMAMTSLSLSFILSLCFNVLVPHHFDTASLYNALAISIALGGHYLIVTKFTIVWIVLVLVLNTLMWGFLQRVFDMHGLPLFILPSNLLLMGSLFIFEKSPSVFGLKKLLVPAPLRDLKVEHIRLWYERRETAHQCWDLIESYQGKQTLS
ncbi:MAG: urea transporter [Deltaproteobacteria bacterium]|nr:urea transporter [Deltaproteobacteria bacterium]